MKPLFSTLISLVGENPLPIYLGIQQYAKPDATIILVHSKDNGEQKGTRAQAQAIGKMLTHPNIQYVETAPYKPSDVMTTLGTLLKNFPDAGLNYTGGTKVMSAFSVYEMSKQVPSEADLFSRVFYLEEGNGVFQFANEAPDPFASHIHLTLDDLCQLHDVLPHQKKYRNEIEKQGIKFDPELNPAPLSLEDLKNAFVAREELHDKADGSYHVCRSRGRDIDAKYEWLWANRNRLKTEKGDNILWSKFLSVVTTKTAGLWRDALVQTSDGNDKKKCVNRLEIAEGTWMEQLVARLIRCLPADNSRIDFQQTPEIPLIDAGNITVGQEFFFHKRKFESDILVARNRRLYYFSVTTSSDMSLCKSKMFEAEKRAEQIGGGLARSCVVSQIDADAVKKNRATLGDNPKNTIFGEADVAAWMRGSGDSLKKFLEQ